MAAAALRNARPDGKMVSKTERGDSRQKTGSEQGDATKGSWGCVEPRWAVIRSTGDPLLWLGSPSNKAIREGGPECSLVPEECAISRLVPSLACATSLYDFETKPVGETNYIYI